MNELHASAVAITVDNQPITLPDKHTSPSEVLRAAGLDPMTYDLVKIVGKGKPLPLNDNQPLTIKSGDDFVSVRQSAQVA